MRRNVQRALWGVTLIALASLYLSYRRLLATVELAASSAGYVERGAAIVVATGAPSST
jgi:hypothetical protein